MSQSLVNDIFQKNFGRNAAGSYWADRYAQGDLTPQQLEAAIVAGAQTNTSAQSQADTNYYQTNVAQTPAPTMAPTMAPTQAPTQAPANSYVAQVDQIFQDNFGRAPAGDYWYNNASAYQNTGDLSQAIIAGAMNNGSAQSQADLNYYNTNVANQPSFSGTNFITPGYEYKPLTIQETIDMILGTPQGQKLNEIQRYQLQQGQTVTGMDSPVWNVNANFDASKTYIDSINNQIRNAGRYLQTPTDFQAFSQAKFNPITGRIDVVDKNGNKLSEVSLGTAGYATLDRLGVDPNSYVQSVNAYLNSDYNTLPYDTDINRVRKEAEAYRPLDLGSGEAFLRTPEQAARNPDQSRMSVKEFMEITGLPFTQATSLLSSNGVNGIGAMALLDWNAIKNSSDPLGAFNASLNAIRQDPDLAAKMEEYDKIQYEANKDFFDERYKPQPEGNPATFGLEGYNSITTMSQNPATGQFSESTGMPSGLINSQFQLPNFSFAQNSGATSTGATGSTQAVEFNGYNAPQYIDFSTGVVSHTPPPGMNTGASSPGTETLGNEYITTVSQNPTTGQFSESQGRPQQNITAPTYQQAAQMSVTDDMLVRNQLDSLLQSDSPYLKAARQRALANSNSRGLINSSIAATSGERAAIEAAMPIAMQDAGTYFNAATANLSAENQFALQSNDRLFAEYQNALDRQQQFGILDQQQAFAEAQAALDRQQQLTMQGNQFNFTGQQNALDRQQQTNILNQQQSFAGQQNSLDRQQQRDLFDAEVNSNMLFRQFDLYADQTLAQQDFAFRSNLFDRQVQSQADLAELQGYLNERSIALQGNVNQGLRNNDFQNDLALFREQSRINTGQNYINQLAAIMASDLPPSVQVGLQAELQKAYASVFNFGSAVNQTSAF